MMTLDETIKALEKIPARHELTADVPAHLKDYRAMLKGENDPLTWDELNQMDGVPVWIELVEETMRNTHIIGFWGLVLVANESFLTVRDISGNLRRFRREEQNEFWQAYRKERE